MWWCDLGWASQNPTAWIVGRWGMTSLSIFDEQMSTIASISKHSFESHLLRPILQREEVLIPFAWSVKKPDPVMNINNYIVHPSHADKCQTKMRQGMCILVVTQQNIPNILSQQAMMSYDDCHRGQVASEFYVLLEGSPENQVLEPLSQGKDSRNGACVCIYIYILYIYCVL